MSEKEERILGQLKQLFAEQTGNNNLQVTEDTALLSDLGMNSLELVQLVCVIEDTFDVEIPDREIRHFKTVGNVVRWIDSHTSDEN